MMMYEMISCLKDYAKIRNEYCFKSEMNIVPYFAKIHIVICYWSLLVRDASSTSAPQYHQKIGPVTKDIIFYNKWHIFVLTYDMHFLTRAFDLKRHIYITCYKCDHLYHAKCTFFKPILHCNFFVRSHAPLVRVPKLYFCDSVFCYT